MLGRLSMTIDECIRAYEELIPKIFGKRRWLHFGNTKVVPRYKYDATRLEIALKDFLLLRSGKSDMILKQPNEDMCRMQVSLLSEYNSLDNLLPVLRWHGSKMETMTW